MDDKKLSILVVDDEHDICFLLKKFLDKNFIASVDVSYSVKSAKELLDEKKFDVVFFDYNLQDGTGIDLINHTKLTPETKPYTVVMSAFSSSSDIKNLEEIGINYFISKPLSQQKIVESLLNFKRH